MEPVGDSPQESPSQAPSSFSPTDGQKLEQCPQPCDNRMSPPPPEASPHLLPCWLTQEEPWGQALAERVTHKNLEDEMLRITQSPNTGPQTSLLCPPMGWGPPGLEGAGDGQRVRAGGGSRVWGEEGQRNTRLFLLSIPHLHRGLERQ